jgi:MATE family multidrug resistance protein
VTFAVETQEDFAARLLRHLRALYALAWPVMLSRAGILMMALVDVIMLGRYDTIALAQASLALGLFIPVMVTCVGLQMGVLSIVSRRHGAGDAEACVATWRRALPWAALTSGVGAGLIWFGESWLILFGQNREMAAGGGAVARFLAPGLMLQVLYVTCAFYLEGTGRPKPALLAMIAANLLNVALNWVFIYGNLGAPELGAVGSALATSLVRAFLFAALLAYILTRPEVRAATGAFVRGVWGAGGWAAGAEMRRLGFAAGLSVFFETTAFGALTMIAGLIGPVALAAYTIAHNVEATVFMAALGLSVATGVRVGGAWGAGRRDDAAFAGWTGLAACAGLMGAIGLGIHLAAAPLSGIYSSDAAVAAAAGALLPIVAFTVIPDGMQIVVGQCNRALGDAYIASGLYFAAFWCVMVPLGAFLSLSAGMGAAGLLTATLVGASVSVLLQGARFRALAGR